MTTEKEANADSGDSPKIRIQVPTGSFPDERLRKTLVKAGIEVEEIEESAGIRDAVTDGDADVVVLRSSEVRGSTARFLERHVDDEDGPSILIVNDEETDPARRASLLAAGASEVVEPEHFEDPENIRPLIDALAQEEGREGPEVRGHDAHPRLADFLSRSESMQRLVALASRVADAETTLLITGETGVGKERLARALHAESSRGPGPFIAVNCGALPEQLLESQLFGHEKGAFTGAQTAHRGFFEQADGGTIFLDEIGEMPTHLQVKLLNVLQRHEIQRIGSESPIRVNVRVMTATNRDLRAEVEAERFREDLFYRLNVVALRIPPLRERPEDVVDLAGHLIRHFRMEIPNSEIKSISTQAMDVLQRYGWPGNVRELINVIERAMLLGQSTAIEPRDLPPEIRSEEASGPVTESAPGHERAVSRASLGERLLPDNWHEKHLKEVRDGAVAEIERSYLHAALGRTQGRINAAAKIAGISTRSLYDKMRRLGLRKEDYRGE
ncbi:MAG: sigma-54 dependent transcriptional regulator [Planctomycetota bacterium]